MTVDHRISRRRRPDLARDPNNLQTLCATCHNRAKQRHEARAADPMAGGIGADGMPLDPRHPWHTGRLGVIRGEAGDKGRPRPRRVPWPSKPI